MSLTAVPAAVRSRAGEWQSLRHPAPADRFHLAMLVGLPPTAQRYLAHAVDPGTPLFGSVELTMHGRIRLGRWHSFTARQVLAPGIGFIWAATARVAGLPVSGFDRYSSGEGQMRWRLLGALPVLSARGADVSRSAAGRLAGEAVFCPTGFTRCAWQPGTQPDLVDAHWRIGTDDHVVTLRVDRNGTLHEVSLNRWGNPDGAAYGYHPFVVAMTDERRFSGVTMPTRFTAAWGGVTRGAAAAAFFEATIIDARFG